MSQFVKQIGIAISTLMLVAPLCFANSQFVFDAPTQKSETWNVIQVEEWIRLKVSDAIENAIPDHRFYVDVQVNTTKLVRKIAYRKRRFINLDKFDVRVPIGPKQYRQARLPKDLFKRIDSIDVEIVVEPGLSTEKQALIQEIPFKVIHFVRPSQVVVNVNRFEDGGYSLVQWFSKYHIGLAILSIGLGLGLFFLMSLWVLNRMATRFVDVFANLGVKTIETLNKNSNPQEGNSDDGGDTGGGGIELVSKEDNPDEDSEVHSFFGKADEAPELIKDDRSKLDRIENLKLKQAIVGLMPVDAAAVIKADVEVGAILLEHLPATRQAKTLALLSPNLIEAITNFGFEAELEFDDEFSQKLIRLSLDVKKERQAQVPNTIKSAISNFPEFDSDQQTAIFDSIADSKQPRLLKDTAQIYIPEETFEELSIETLRAGIVAMPLEDIVILACFTKENGKNKTYEAVVTMESKVSDYVKKEVDEHLKDSDQYLKTKNQYDRVYRQYVENVRIYLKSDDKAWKQAEPIIEKWVKKKYWKNNESAA